MIWEIFTLLFMLRVYDILSLLSAAPAIPASKNARNNILSVGFQHLRSRGFAFFLSPFAEHLHRVTYCNRDARIFIYRITYQTVLRVRPFSTWNRNDVCSFSAMNRDTRCELQRPRVKWIQLYTCSAVSWIFHGVVWELCMGPWRKLEVALH